MTIFHALILGIIEGITEFLPISSTGHLILASHLLGLVESDFLKSFEIIIQLGAICAVVILYFRVLIKNMRLWGKLIAAFIPTGLAGFLLYSYIKEYLLGNTTVVLWALALGGVALIGYELFERFWVGPKTSFSSSSPLAGTTTAHITLKQAVSIGAIQILSFIPGVSRSASTIIGGRAVGLTRRNAVEFSFLLAVPTMLAATGYDLFKNIHLFTLGNIGLLSVGFITAFIFAVFSIIFFMHYIERHTLIPFGIYRIILAILFFLAVR